MSAVITTTPSAAPGTAESSLQQNIEAANGDAIARLAAFQTYAQDRCAELNAEGITSDCPDHCDIVLTAEELAVGRAAVERLKLRRSTP